MMTDYGDDADSFVVIDALRARIAELEAFKANVPWKAIMLTQSIAWNRTPDGDPALKPVAQLGEWYNANRPKEGK